MRARRSNSIVGDVMQCAPADALTVIVGTLGKIKERVYDFIWNLNDPSRAGLCLPLGMAMYCIGWWRRWGWERSFLSGCRGDGIDINQRVPRYAKNRLLRVGRADDSIRHPDNLERPTLRAASRPLQWSGSTLGYFGPLLASHSAYEQMRKMLAEFGMTPGSRSRVTKAPTEEADLRDVREEAAKLKVSGTH